MSDTVTVEELDAQIDLRKNRFKQVTGEIRTVLREDIALFVPREVKKAFLASTSAAEAMDKSKVAKLKEKANELAHDLAARVDSALADDAIWATGGEVPKNKNDISGQAAVWEKVQPVERDVQALLDEFNDIAMKIAEDPDEYSEGAYYLPVQSRWPKLMTVAENRAEAIDKALIAIEDMNARYLHGVLAGVRFNDERRFGDAATMDGLMQRLLAHFSKIPLGNRDLLEPDVLGNAYEFLIERFAETAGKKGGEFYTPRGVVRLLVELLDPREGMRIHDPTCGSGGMLIECGHHIEERGGNPRNLTLTGQEKNIGTWAICRLNMLLHGFPDADIRSGDTIRNPRFTTHGALDPFDRSVSPKISCQLDGFRICIP